MSPFPNGDASEGETGMEKTSCCGRNAMQEVFHPIMKIWICFSAGALERLDATCPFAV